MAKNITPAPRTWPAWISLTASVEKMVTGRTSLVTRRVNTGWWESLKIPCRFRSWMKITRRKKMVTGFYSGYRWSMAIPREISDYFFQYW
jgi:hypothetical protein